MIIVTLKLPHIPQLLHHKSSMLLCSTMPNIIHPNSNFQKIYSLDNSLDSIIRNSINSINSYVGSKITTPQINYLFNAEGIERNNATIGRFTIIISLTIIILMIHTVLDRLDLDIPEWIKSIECITVLCLFVSVLYQIIR